MDYIIIWWLIYAVTITSSARSSAVMMKSTTNILKQLRGCMKDVTYVKEPLQAYIIPSEDAHQNEYISDSDARREYVSGFTGSAGTAVVTQNEALLWTDGRYYLQAEQELDSNWKLMKENDPDTLNIPDYLSKTLPNNSRIGVDGTLYAYRSLSTFESVLKSWGHELVSVRTNLVDLVWTNRPNRPNNPIIILDRKYTGESCSEKLGRIRKQMVDKLADVLVVTALDEIAWVLNVRGSDISFNPVFYSYLVIRKDTIHLFIDASKINQTVLDHFKNEGILVNIHPYENFYPFLSQTTSQLSPTKRGWVSPKSSYEVVHSIPEESRVLAVTPVLTMKAIKNEVEVAGMKNAHIKDGAALACYFSWLEKQVKSNQKITETAAAAKLEEFRRLQENFVSNSFDTISAFGPHGAIIHFHPTEKENLVITDQSMYLCDSGAQYKDGTTDLTRTMHFGNPTDFEIEAFTRVYKGQNFLTTAIFPNKTLGNSLDSYARRYLWEVGLNYGHGTSHGIGCYLNVHEGPIGITWRNMPDDPGLQENMFLSNEPGYYEAGKFGVRIEDIVRVVKAKTPHNFDNRGYLTFEIVSFVPIQTKLINKSMLSEAELVTLNNYNQKVRDTIGPLLQKQGQMEAYNWLIEETKAI